MEILALIVLLYQWVMEAALRYNSTEEGAARLADIETRLEALGIDVPGFEPTSQGEPLVMNKQQAGEPLNDAEAISAFRARHPEIFNKESVQ